MRDGFACGVVPGYVRDEQGSEGDKVLVRRRRGGAPRHRDSCHHVQGESPSIIVRPVCLLFHQLAQLSKESHLLLDGAARTVGKSNSHWWKIFDRNRRPMMCVLEARGLLVSSFPFCCGPLFSIQSSIQGVCVVV